MDNMREVENFSQEKEEMKTVILKELYSVLNEFKNTKHLTKETDIERQIYEKICDFKQNFKDNKFPLGSEFFYEETAFALRERNEKSDSKEWEGLHYGPLWSGQDKKGSIAFSYPDIEHITLKMINYWEKRSDETEDSPTLQCRYAGLVWGFSQKIKNERPNISSAHKFIDSIIKLTDLEGYPFLQNKFERCLRLVVALNDQKRIASVRDAIIKYEDGYSKDDRPRTWGYSFDLLIREKDLSHKVQLTKEQEEAIIKELERKLKTFSDKNPKTFDLNSAECIITKLVPYYKSKNDTKNMKRVLLIFRDSSLWGIENNLVMGAGSICLERVRKILFQYGLSDKAKKLESDIRSGQKEDLKRLRKIETPIEIPKKEIDNYLNELDRKSLSEALNDIAVSFIPNKKQAKDTVLKTAKEHPLLCFLPSSIMDYTGRKIAEIGSIEDDLEGHIIQNISRSIQWLLPWIRLGLDHLEKNKSLSANTLSEHLFKSLVFPEENHQIIKEGLIAYFNKNYIASCFVLIPQIESAIRNLISVAGGEIYQSPGNFKERGFQLKPLGGLLIDERFIKSFRESGEDVSTFFRVLLTDKRGLNLRNNICHGHFPSTFLNQRTAIHIIHILLILSVLRETKNSQDKETP